MESFQTVWKVSGQPGEVLNGQESFQTVLKVSGHYGKVPDSLESFRTVWKVSRQSGKFLAGQIRGQVSVCRVLNALPNNVENKVEAIMEPCAAGTHLATDLTCKSGKFPDSLNSF